MAKELDGMMKKLMAKSKRDWETKGLPEVNKRLAEGAKAEKERRKAEEKRCAGQCMAGSDCDGCVPHKVTMTDEQIENWRRVLCKILGPYAMIMSKEDIQKFKDRMQVDVYALDKKLQAEDEKT